MQVINSATLNSFRKFTLTSGYDNENTRFVRVKDGYSVGADPLLINKGGKLKPHHVKYEGFLYGCRKGYVLATLKEGYGGWTDIVETEENTFKCFNPFKGKTLTIERGTTSLVITDGKDGKDVISIGRFSTVFGEMNVYATPFKGLRSFMRLIRKLPEWATVHVNNVSYNESMTLKYDMGVVTEGSFDPLESFDLRTVEYCVVDRSNTLVKYQGRYFTMQEDTWMCPHRSFLSEKGIPTLKEASSHYENTVDIPSNSEYETTEVQWNRYTEGKDIISGRVFMDRNPEDIRPLHHVEEELLNCKDAPSQFTLMEYMKYTLGLGNPANGIMYDNRDIFRRRKSHEVNPNITAVYTALIKEAKSQNAAQLLSNLMYMPCTVDSLYKAYQFESDRMLGTFLHVCIEEGKDIERLWLDAIALTPQPMEEWINTRLIYWVEERYTGYSYYVNSAWAEKRNYQGKIVYIFAEAASFAQYSPKEVTLEEYTTYVERLKAERAYKDRYDAVPSDVHDKHLYLKQQDNPELYPKATGKGELSGCTDMGSCQCGDVDWWVKYDCDTLEFSFGNSNWSNGSDYHIPYVGNALDMVVDATNITQGWKCVS